MIALIQEAAEKAQEAQPLTTGGWIMMILSIGFVTVLVVTCYIRILSHPEQQEPDLPGGLGP